MHETTNITKQQHSSWTKRGFILALFCALNGLTVAQNTGVAESTVAKDEKITISGGRTESSAGGQARTVGGVRSVTVGAVQQPTLGTSDQPSQPPGVPLPYPNAGKTDSAHDSTQPAGQGIRRIHAQHDMGTAVSTDHPRNPANPSATVRSRTNSRTSLWNDGYRALRHSSTKPGPGSNSLQDHTVGDPRAAVAVKHFDPVVGIDIHLGPTAPSNGRIPLALPTARMPSALQSSSVPGGGANPQNLTRALPLSNRGAGRAPMMPRVHASGAMRPGR